MNKILLSAIATATLFAQTQFYVYTPILDYKEYVNSSVIDKDYTEFGDMVGVGIYYQSQTRPFKFTFRFEYAGGESTYEGATWDGTPIKNNQTGVYILNTEAAIGRKNFFLTLGYREWNRGKSEYVGDYDEKYYWGYFGVRVEHKLYFGNIAFTPQFSYQMAISPKLKVYMGNDPILDLGTTTGAYINLPLYFRANNNFVWFVFYKYQYWHISKSDPETLVVNNTATTIYEPESITKINTLGAGVLYSF